EAALLEPHLVEFRRRDVALVRARLAHADRLAVVVQVLAREAQPLARLEQRDEPGADLERELPFEVRPSRLRPDPPLLRGLDPRAPLAPERDLLLDAGRRRHRLTRGESGRVRSPERQVPDAGR